jgi:hypothetical protein
VRPERLELPTLCSEGRCSIRLSYGRPWVFYGKTGVARGRVAASSVFDAVRYAGVARLQLDNSGSRSSRTECSACAGVRSRPILDTDRRESSASSSLGSDCCRLSGDVRDCAQEPCHSLLPATLPPLTGSPRQPRLQTRPVTIARCLSDTFAGIQPAEAPRFIMAQLTGALAATSCFGGSFQTCQLMSGKSWFRTSCTEETEYPFLTFTAGSLAPSPMLG